MILFPRDGNRWTATAAGVVYAAMVLMFFAGAGCRERTATTTPSLLESLDGPDFKDGEYLPAIPEREAVPKSKITITRKSPEFKRLVRCIDEDIVFKMEEGTNADRMMTGTLRKRLRSLARLVKQEWPDLRLRVTEAWDEEGEHSANSAHYEGRAVDLTVSDKDLAKLGRLARLAVMAGFEWVYYEHDHVHASVSK